ncbi:MAG: RNA polymerase factor sigma-54 [Proteobacteria bacterium]|nr:RNA polymerase factor sigma-54 [Pseudomonadota bacterium]
MALEIKLNQKLSQSLVMTPQLQQAIKLLQLGRMEYLEVIDQELISNPVLEDLRENDSNSEQHLTPSKNTETEFIELPDSLPDSSIQIRDYFGEHMPESNFYSHVRNSNIESEKNSLENRLCNQEGLFAHLISQIRSSEIKVSEQEIATYIIGNLDKNGYLSVSVEEIAEDAKCEVSEVETVLAIIQQFDPLGIGARDLRECLLIQLEASGMKDTLSWRIVSDNLAELEIKKYDVIAKKNGVLLEDVFEAVREIQKLEPRPGRSFVEEEPIYITPDVYIKKVGDNYVITLNDAGMPKLRLNPIYHEMLAKLQTATGEEKEYLSEKVRSATWLIKSIEQRQQTIYKVSQSIIRFQKEFLENGISALKPLVLKDVAEDLGMHESTISRVTTNKYIHTPHGVFELKFFFTSGLKSDGGDVSSESVKEKIRELVSKENPKKPLSDQAIVSALKKQGIDIARRTVAKYREMMSILSSSRRKQVF